MRFVPYLEGGAGMIHHISNAGTRSPNQGINTHLALLGFTFFLR